MGVKKHIAENNLDPCYFCEYEYYRQVDQFGYEIGCKKDAPQKVYNSGYGCYQFKKRKKGGDKS